MARTPGAGSWADKAASPVPHRPKARPPVPPVPAGLLPSVSPSTSSCVASTRPPQSGEGAWRYLGGIGAWAGRGFKPQLPLLRPCGMVGAGGAVCTTVFHSGPLAQAGRPPKPSPWASRLGRGRGGKMGRWEGRGGPREASKAERVARGWRERERTERERREEKTEATTVGKTRKWQEMGEL